MLKKELTTKFQTSLANSNSGGLGAPAPILKETMFFVYRIYDNSGASYVGVTEFLEKRINTHLSGQGSSKIREALDKGIKFSWETLIEVSEFNIAYELEKEFILKYDSVNRGYNITPGGFGGFKSNRKGELNTQAILTEDQVYDIRIEFFNSDVTQASLASKYGVNRETISAITRGKSWKEVGGPTGLKKIAKTVEITPELINKIQELRKNKTPYLKIAEELNITNYYAYKYGKGVI